MNLQSLVAPVIAAINPMMTVGIRVSSGYATNGAGQRTPAYQTPGSITASIDGAALDVTGVASGVLASGQMLSDAEGRVLPGTIITAQLSGTPGGIGTYSLNQSQSVASEAMTTMLSLSAQVQALSGRDLRQIEGLNLQGTLRTIYVNGNLSGAVRVSVKGGDLVTLPDGSVWLVSLVAEPWDLTAGWTKAIITLQDGA